MPWQANTGILGASPRQVTPMSGAPLIGELARVGSTTDGEPARAPLWCIGDLPAWAVPW